MIRQPVAPLVVTIEMMTGRDYGLAKPRRCNKNGKEFSLRSIFNTYGIVESITAPA